MSTSARQSTNPSWNRRNPQIWTLGVATWWWWTTWNCFYENISHKKCRLLLNVFQTSAVLFTFSSVESKRNCKTLPKIRNIIFDLFLLFAVAVAPCGMQPLHRIHAVRANMFSGKQFRRVRWHIRQVLVGVGVGDSFRSFYRNPMQNAFGQLFHGIVSVATRITWTSFSTLPLHPQFAHTPSKKFSTTEYDFHLAAAAAIEKTLGCHLATCVWILITS